MGKRASDGCGWHAGFDPHCGGCTSGVVEEAAREQRRQTRELREQTALLRRHGAGGRSQGDVDADLAAGMLAHHLRTTPTGPAEPPPPSLTRRLIVAYRRGMGWAGDPRLTREQEDEQRARAKDAEQARMRLSGMSEKEFTLRRKIRQAYAARKHAKAGRLELELSGLLEKERRARLKARQG